METMHIRWKDRLLAAGGHLPDAHDGGTRCKDCNADLVPWAVLQPARKKMLAEFVDLFLEALETQNYLVIDRSVASSKVTLNDKQVRALQELIAEFVKGLKHPKGVADLFPVNELAAKVLLRFHVPEAPVIKQNQGQDEKQSTKAGKEASTEGSGKEEASTAKKRGRHRKGA